MGTISAFQDGYLIDGEFVEIDKASKFQESLRRSKVVKCETPELENKIFKIEPEMRIVVKSTISSPKTIIFAEPYDKDFLEKNL